jgi:K+-transporting ATPase ATPase A chain
LFYLGQNYFEWGQIMTRIGIYQLVLYFGVLIALIKPLGVYMYRVYSGQRCGLDRLLAPVEGFIYRLCGIRAEQEMTWKSYLVAMLLFNLIGLFVLYGIQRLQPYLPLNPQKFAAVPTDLAFNTAVSFITNTNWQAYAGESTLSQTTQMLGLAVQNFFSAASGLSLMIALIRGLARSQAKTLGNFWIDTTRGILYILLPFSFIIAIILASQGVIQNFKPYQEVHVISKESDKQTLPMGPVASQIAIKQLATNGGGYFNVNSAHPYENPTPLTNFIEMLAILLLPAALCYTFGRMVRDQLQGWALLLVMFIIFVPMTIMTITCEQKGNPALSSLLFEQKSPDMMHPDGNMEGKEVRFGIVNSALWANASTATSNGSVNSMLDSYTPLGILSCLWLMQLGEVIFGGIGTGLSGMLMLVIVTVFVAGLMVGRTPEFLGKKIEPYEMKMASLAILLMPIIVLFTTSIAVLTHQGTEVVNNPGPHAFMEILYAFTSMGNNNGSGLAGLNANTPFYNVLGGITMLLGRYWIAIATLAVAGSLVKKKLVPRSAGTLPTHTPLFIIFLICVILIVGALTFFPALALGPIVAHLILWGYHGF